MAFCFVTCLFRETSTAPANIERQTLSEAGGFDFIVPVPNLCAGVGKFLGDTAMPVTVRRGLAHPTLRGRAKQSLVDLTYGAIRTQNTSTLDLLAVVLSIRPPVFDKGFEVLLAEFFARAP